MRVQVSVAIRSPAGIQSGPCTAPASRRALRRLLCVCPPGFGAGTVAAESPSHRRGAAGPRAHARPLAAALLLALGAVATESRSQPPIAPPTFDADRQAFAAELSQRHGLPAAEVAALLADARFEQRVIDAVERPYEARPWPEYRALFLTPERIRGGVAYQAAHADLLARAAAEYGVDPAVIVAIIGIETNYGRRLGDYRALDAMATLGFAFPRRAAFFREQLAAFVLLARQEGIDPRSAMGSYAGALGKPQFIPTSWRDFAVDFDRDGRRDLFTSDADVIGSVANYLARHGWRPGAPVALPARLAQPGGPPAGIEIGGAQPLAPNTTLGELAAVGVTPAPGAPALPADTRAALLSFEGGDWLLAFDNFHAITRYNHSNLYARAVLELGQAVTAARVAASSAATTGGNHVHDNPDGGPPGTPD